MTAILALITISLFEDIVVKVVAFAVLTSMGGIAGNKTLTTNDSSNGI